MMKKLAIAVGLLSLLATGCGQETATDNQPLHVESTSGDFLATIDLTPGHVGPNEYQVTISDAAKQLQKEGKVILHFAMNGMEHGQSEEELQLQADGKWHGKGPNIMMEGQWQFQVEWDQSPQAKQLFDFAATIKD